MNQMLVYLDYTGIACMTFSLPWVYIRTFEVHNYEDTQFLLFVAIISILYAAVTGSYIYLFVMQISSRIIHENCQLSLFVLGVIAGYPIYYAYLFQPYDYENYWRFMAGMCLIIGYIIYQLRFPEILMRDGASDGKIWNSHVMWHIFVSIAQYVYLINC